MCNNTAGSEHAGLAGERAGRRLVGGRYDLGFAIAIVTAVYVAAGMILLIAGILRFIRRDAARLAALWCNYATGIMNMVERLGGTRASA